MDDVQNDLVKTQQDVTQQGVVNDQYNTEGNVCCTVHSIEFMPNLVWKVHVMYA